MTDAELLELVQEKRPGEFRPEELQLLRWRMEESPELKAAIGARVASEEQLTVLLSHLNELTHAGSAPAPSRWPWPAIAATTALGLACLFVLGVLTQAALGTRPTSRTNRTLFARYSPPQPATQPGRKTQTDAPSAHAQDDETTAAAQTRETPVVETAPVATTVATDSAKPEPPPVPAVAAKPPIVLAANETPVASAAPAAPKSPWDDLLAQSPPRSYRENLYLDFDTAKSLPQKNDLRKWLAEVPGHKLEIRTSNSRYGNCGGFEGLARINTPFTAESVVRLSLENYDRLKLHFYAGSEGVTFAYHEHRNLTWAAFATARKADAPLPERLTLCGTDGGRWQRTEMRFGGAFELRWRAGEMLLSRGDVVILRAPLASPPTDVFLDGRATFYGLTVLREKDFPPAELAAPPTVEFTKPAELAFGPAPPEGISLEKSPTGGVALVAEKSKQAAATTAPLPNVGPAELILRLDDIAPGSGIFIAGADKQPQIAARFLKDQRTGLLSVHLRGLDDGLIGDVPPWRETFAPHVASPLWLRFTYGAGLLRVAVSPNGRHWGEAVDMQRNVIRNFSHVGLFFPGNGATGTLRVGYIALRKFNHLSTPESDKLFAQAPEIIESPTPGSWLTAVSQAQPATVDTKAWRRACALKTLGRSAPHGIGQPLLEMLLDDTAASPVTAAQQLATLTDAAPLVDLYDNNVAQRFAERYARVGEAAAAAGEPRPFTLVWPAVLDSTPLPPQFMRPALEPLLRTEVLQLAFADRAQDLANLAREMTYFHWNEDLPLITWAEYLAGRRAEVAAAPGRQPPGQRDEWPSVVVENIDKETFNALADLLAVLDNETPDDAVRTLSGLDPLTLTGLAPAPRDRWLNVSLRTAVASLVGENAKLREAITKQLGDTAQRRIDQAILTGNEPAVRLATLQFSETPAVVHAFSWLGDRALVAGKFSAALTEYERALAASPGAASPNLLARERYAAAWLGRTVGKPPLATVSLGEVNLSPAEFETLVAEALKRADTSVLGAATSFAGVPAAPKPSGFKVDRRDKLEGELGDKANEIPGNFLIWNTSPLERQLSVAVEGGTAYVSTRFQIQALDLSNGKVKWRSPAPAQRAYAYDWPLVPHRPLVTAKNIYSRFLLPQGPALACLDKANGASVWTFVPPSAGSIASDPVIYGSELFVLAVTPTEQRERSLKLLAFDARTGELLRSHDWLRLTESWNVRRMAQVALHDDLLVASLGGAVVCGDLTTGQVRWLRRSVALPSDVDRESLLQEHEPPLVRGNRLFVVQPRVRAIECLDLEAGKLTWRVVLPTVRGLIGFADKLLIARTDDGFTALDSETGQQKWQHETRDVGEAVASGGEGKLMYVRRQASDSGSPEKYPQLVWLNPATGQTVATTDLTNLKNDAPSLGPLWRSGDKLWALFGKAGDVAREFVELTPEGNARQVSTGPSPPRRVNAHVPEAIRNGAANLYGDWEVLGAGGGPIQGLRTDFLGEKDVLLGYAAPPQFFDLGRFGTLPAGKSKLALKVGAAKDQPWKLAVYFGNKPLVEKEFDGKDPVWREVEVDLKPVANQTGWLIIRAWHTSGGNDRALGFKRLEFIP